MRSAENHVPGAPTSFPSRLRALQRERSGSPEEKFRVVEHTLVLVGRVACLVLGTLLLTVGCLIGILGNATDPLTPVGFIAAGGAMIRFGARPADVPPTDR